MCNNKANLQEIKTVAAKQRTLLKTRCADEMKAWCARLGEPDADESVYPDWPHMDPCHAVVDQQPYVYMQRGLIDGGRLKTGRPTKG